MSRVSVVVHRQFELSCGPYTVSEMCCWQRSFALIQAEGWGQLVLAQGAELWVLQNHPFPNSSPVPQRKESNIPTLFLATQCSPTARMELLHVPYAVGKPKLTFSRAPEQELLGSHPAILAADCLL